MTSEEEGWYAGSVQVIMLPAPLVVAALSPLAQNKIIVRFSAGSLDWKCPGWIRACLSWDRQQLSSPELTRIKIFVFNFE